MADIERDIEGIYRTINALEKNVDEQIKQLKQQLFDLSKLPVEVATLKERAGNQQGNVERLSNELNEKNVNVQQEISAIRERAEKNNDFAVDRFDSLTKSLGSATERIEQKFGSKIEDIKKELHNLVSDYDKRIAAMKAIAAAVGVGFTVLQGVVGLGISSYVNGWKARVDEAEVAIKDLRKNQANSDALIKELQQESLRRK